VTDSAVNGTRCRACGEPLPSPAATDAESSPDRAADTMCGGPFALVTCPACGTEQVNTGGTEFCDGERLALQNALAYLARRRATDKKRPSP
jgi:hypothetical protein